MTTNSDFVEANLLALLGEISAQVEVGDLFPAYMQSFSEQIEQLREYIEDAGEYRVAYEVLVSMLEVFPFRLSGKGAIKLLNS